MPCTSDCNVNSACLVLRRGYQLISLMYPDCTPLALAAQAANSSAQGASLQLTSAEDFCEALVSVLHGVISACSLGTNGESGSIDIENRVHTSSPEAMASSIADVLNDVQTYCKSPWLVPLAVASWCRQLLARQPTLPTIDSDLSKADDTLGPDEAQSWIAVLHAIKSFLQSVESDAVAELDMSTDEVVLQGLAQLESFSRFKWTARLRSLQKHVTKLEGVVAGQSGAICELLAVLVPSEIDLARDASQVARSIEGPAA